MGFFSLFGGKSPEAKREKARQTIAQFRQYLALGKDSLPFKKLAKQLQMQPEEYEQYCMEKIAQAQKILEET